MSLAAREHWTRGARPDVAEGFAVLTYLVEHAGRLVTHDELLEAVWPNVVVEPQAVKKHILAVRSTLRDRPKNPVFLETMIKRGYRFIAPVSNSSAGGHVERGERAQGALVGRAVALEELRERWRIASVGERQIILITGAPGIGKTALAEEFLYQLAAAGGTASTGTSGYRNSANNWRVRFWGAEKVPPR